MNKANKEYELFAFNRAIKTYLKAIETEGYSAESIAHLADCYRNLNQPENAAKWYAKATELGGISPQQIFNYGQVLATLQKYDEAAQWFTVYAGTETTVGAHYAENATYAKARINDATAYKVKNLSLNTSQSEFAPTFFNEKLVFASARTDIKKNQTSKTWIGKAANRLFMANGGKTGKLSAPNLLHSQLKNAFNEGPLSFSPDGNLVAFTKNNFNSGTRQTPSGGMQMSIFMGEVDNEDWTGSTAFVHNAVNSNSGYPSFSPDGKALYFASDRPGGFGGYDIYVCFKYENSWSAPENLGPVVNSQGNEITPFFDGTDLTFASDYHSGFGGYDVFRAEKTDFNFDRVYHLGTGVNTSYDDYGFIYDKSTNQGYLTSNRKGGKGAEDIYSVRLVSNQVVISVINESTGAPLAGASLDLGNCGLGIIKTNANGRIKLETVEGIDCGIAVSMPEFVAQTQQINTLSGKRDFKIGLKKESDITIGQVLHASTGAPLEDVTVKVTNRSKGSTLSVITDAQGKYSLAMSGDTKYNLRYSKVGYLEINQMIRNGATDGLKTIRLSPVDAITNQANTTSASSANSTKKTTSAPPAEPAVPKESGPITTLPNLDILTTPLDEGYAIQVMSLKTGDVQMADLEAKYSEIGAVYSKEINGMTKVRVGMFETKDEARKAQSALRTKGIEAGFIVPDMHPLKLQEKERAAVAAREKAAKEAAARKAAEKALANKPTTTAKGDIGTYKVRLGAYRNPQFFDSAAVKDIGTIERIKRGDFTIMVLTGFGNKWEANNGLKKAKAAGFNDAYVFNYQNGKMSRVK